MPSSLFLLVSLFAIAACNHIEIIQSICPLLPGDGFLGRSIRQECFTLGQEDDPNCPIGEVLIQFNLTGCDPRCSPGSLTGPFQCYTQQDLPIMTIPSEVEDAQLFYLSTHEELHTYFSTSQSASASIWKATASLSSQQTRWFDQITNHQHLYIVIQGETQSSRLTVLPEYIQPNAHAVTVFVKPFISLGGWRNNPTLAFDLFQRVGTHLISQVDVGGQWMMTAEVDTSALQVHTKEEVQTQAKIGFLGQLSISEGHSGSYDQQSAWYNATATQQFITRGGNDQGLTDFPKWVPSITANPAILQFASLPVCALLGDPATQLNCLEGLEHYGRRCRLIGAQQAQTVLRQTAQQYRDLPTPSCTCAPCMNVNASAVQQAADVIHSNADQIVNKLNTSIDIIQSALDKGPPFDEDIVDNAEALTQLISATLASPPNSVACWAYQYCDPPFGRCCEGGLSGVCQYQTGVDPCWWRDWPSLKGATVCGTVTAPNELFAK